MLSVIGIGPGSQAMMTMEAVEALQAAEIVVGYKTYTHLVKAFTGDKQVIKTGMCKEIERCQAAIELAQDWRMDRAARKLDAMLLCADRDNLLLVSGTGEVIEPDGGVIAIGSGGNFALAAARALYENTDLSAQEIAGKALKIASDICVYTNSNIIVETV